MRFPDSHRIYRWSVVLLVILLYLPIYTLLADRFLERDSYYSHGFLILPMALYLVWRKRKILRTLPQNTSIWGMLVILFSITIYLLSLLLKFNFGAYISLPFLIFGLVLYLNGWRITRASLLPIVFLFFMLPLPKVLIIGLAFKMKIIASYGAIALIRSIGIAASLNGSYITYPGGSLLIGDPCSGLRSLISFLALGALFTQFANAEFWKKITLFFMALPIALLSNILRIALLLIVAYVYGEEIALGKFHDFSGILLFVGGFFLFILVCKVLRCKIRPKNI